MSRYLKTISATVYRNKKTYLSPGNYTFNIPFSSKEAKVIVFGGGGNACAGQVNAAGTRGNCGYDYGFASGPGGGFSEKLYYGTAGKTACLVVGTCEANSSFCIAGLGTVLATGGKLCRASDGTPWCHCFGIGSGGDINRCGSCGATQCLCYYFQRSGIDCAFNYSLGAWMGGGMPGNTSNNGIAPETPQTTVNSNFYCLRNESISYFGYGCTVNYRACTCIRQISLAVRGFGCCPVSTSTYYGFDWDVIGGDSCVTTPYTTSCTSAWSCIPQFCCVCIGVNCCVTCLNNCYIGCACAQNPGAFSWSSTPCCFGVGSGYVQAVGYYQCSSNNITCIYGTMNAGYTAAGGPGGNGGIGGGGGGVYADPNPCNIGLNYCTILNYTPNSHVRTLLGTGGPGLVVVYY